MINQTGIASQPMVKSMFPSLERIDQGPVVIVECFQQIPCNPCSKVCKFHAISQLADINEIPKVSHDQCVGCGLCVYQCPGLAIMIVDGSISQDFVVFQIPYEFLPLPMVNETVNALDRSGKIIGQAKILKVVNTPRMESTPVLHVQVERKHLHTFRNISLES